MQTDRNAVTRAIKQLKTWDIPQVEIDAIQEDAKKIHANKDEWLRTPEGRWVNREKQSIGGKVDLHKEADNEWGRVTLRAPFDGVIIEQNITVDDMVADNTINLFQIADVSRLLVTVHCQEDDLPTLEALHGEHRRWTVRTAFAPPAGLSGTIDEIGYLIDPNQHTAIIKGYIDNPGQRIRATQFASATVNIPPPSDVVEIPVDALVERRQAEPGVRGARSVQAAVYHAACPCDASVRRHGIRAQTPIPEKERLTDTEKEEGLLPKEPLRPGERVLTAGSVELKRVVIDLDSRTKGKATDLLAKTKGRPAPNLKSPPEHKPKAGKG